MCGLTGFLVGSPQTGNAKLRDIVTRMADTLRHRGPDDAGIWVDEESGVALGFRRLSIVDLSPEGHQPMLSGCGRYVIVFNGEVYNFSSIRQELEALGRYFRGRSDTEVMLAAISQWGLESAVKKFVGMFAFALWDKSERTLHLVRDRLGIKPLYYGWAGKTFLFGSELKALRAHPDFVPTIDRDAISLFMRYSYIPCPYSIYQGIRKLTPGYILSLESFRGKQGSGTDWNNSFKAEPYWDARKLAEQENGVLFNASEEDAIEQLDVLLRDSIRMRMISDVPLGAFLSGGIDSSSVVALMQAQSTRPVKTFAVGFFESNYNEAADAKRVAAHLGTEHTEIYVTPEEAMAVIPKLACLFDEPFSDSSQIPTYLISALARQQVTVGLSGDGGDEVFGGYNRHFLGPAIWRGINRMPKLLRRVGGKSLLVPATATWNKIYSLAARIMPSSYRVEYFGDKIQKLAEVLTADSLEQFYKILVSHWQRPAELVLGACEPPILMGETLGQTESGEFSRRFMLMDLVTYLPDDILTKVDRASMGVSLEARVPLLDHRVVEFATRLPQSMVVDQGKGKKILRQVLYKYVPRRLVERPKMGFTIPLGAWLRGPLREWAEELISIERLTREGYLNPGPIREIWKEHLAGKRDRQTLLWDVLMFQSWHAQWA